MSKKKRSTVKKMCPVCLKLAFVDGHGAFRSHKAKRGLECPGTGTPTSKALKIRAKVVGGGLPGSGKGQ